MASETVVEIRPEDGKWAWERREGGKSVKSGTAKDQRKAIRDARKAAGSTETPLFDEGGTKIGSMRTPVDCRVVLLRADGSEYGELDGAPNPGGGAPQIVNLAPAGENSEAPNLGDAESEDNGEES